MLFFICCFFAFPKIGEGGPALLVDEDEIEYLKLGIVLLNKLFPSYLPYFDILDLQLCGVG